jgi:hypothetical protein
MQRQSYGLEEPLLHCHREPSQWARRNQEELNQGGTSQVMDAHGAIPCQVADFRVSDRSTAVQNLIRMPSHPTGCFFNLFEVYAIRRYGAPRHGPVTRWSEPRF